MTDNDSPEPKQEEEYDEVPDSKAAGPSSPKKRKKGKAASDEDDGAPAKKKKPMQGTGTWSGEAKVALFKRYIAKPTDEDFAALQKETGKTKTQCSDYWRKVMMEKIVKFLEEGA